MAKNFTKLNHKNFPLWKKNIRKNLSIEDKLIYFSLMANPQTDYRGIFEIETDDLIKTGVKIEKIEKAFSNLENHNLIKYDEDNGIVLVPEMVKTQKWGQNEILSLINYIKDEVDSFLILDLIDILQVLDLTEKAKGYLSELQGVSKGYQRGIKGEGVALAIDKNKIRIDKDIELDKIKRENKEKELNIVSEETLVVLDKPKKTRKDESYYFKYYQIWIDFLNLNNNPFKLVKTTANGFRSMIDTIKKYEKKGLTLDIYREALQESQGNSFLFGDNDRNWKMNILSLMEVDKRAKLYAGNYKGIEQKKAEKSFKHALVDNSPADDKWADVEIPY